MAVATPLRTMAVLLGLCLFLLASVAWADLKARKLVSTEELEERATKMNLATVVRVADEVNARELAERHGYVHVGEAHPKLRGYHVFKRSASWHPDLHRPLEEADEILWSQEQRPKPIHLRAFPTDPLFFEQWYLHSSQLDLNVMPAWDKGYTGRGVNIAIVDNGVNYNHPDLLDNYKLEGSWDFVGSDHDSTPGPSDDEHGTASAGIALAKKNNNICGVGVAPQAGLSAIRLISDKGNVDHIEAQALGYRCTPDDDSPFGFMNHIFSASWGPPDDGLTVFGADRLLREAMKHCLEHGRHGKGSIYLWSAGNGRAVRDNANYDGYANLRETIAIGAVDYLGYQAEYSESCACLMAVAPSSGRDKMVATDSLTSCTRVFGGTSAVSPMAAGVIALVLEANPYLYWRDMQQLIVQTSTSEGLDKRQWQTNGAGYRFHHGFGFGLLNAEAMVNAAKDFTSLSPAIMVWHRDQEPIPINKNALSVRKYTLTRAELTKQAGNGGRFVTEHVVVNVAGKYPGGFGGLKLTLISPHGTRSFLAEPHQDVGNVDLSWDFMTVANWGEDPVGDWTLEVSYLSYGRREPAPPYIRAWELDIYGHMVDSHVH